MRKFGYRDCTSNFKISSDTNQFRFDANDHYLRLNLKISTDVQIAPIERVEIYLKNNVLMKNVFMINSKLFYYYEKKWYYSGHSEYIPKPPENVLNRFKFSEEDIVLICANNIPKPANIIWYYLLRIVLFPFTSWLLFPPKILDTKSSIEKNIFIKIGKWNSLPRPRENDLYRK